MKIKLTIKHFPMDSLEFMKSELARYAECSIEQYNDDILVSCDTDVVKCMEVLVVADKFDFNSIESRSLPGQQNPTPS